MNPPMKPSTFSSKPASVDRHVLRTSFADRASAAHSAACWPMTQAALLLGRSAIAPSQPRANQISFIASVRSA